MKRSQLILVGVLCTAFVHLPLRASAQAIETVGSRALGMGGAFVAIADDASATWWNPAGLGPGPFLDLTLAMARIEQPDHVPAWHAGTSWLAVATPPFGVSYYRFRITDIRPFDPTGGNSPGREDRRAGVPVRSLSASQVGITVLRTLITGVHAGTTIKYVRATHRSTRADSASEPAELLDLGEDLSGGDSEGHVDLDIGLMAVAGMLRLGAVVRNVREIEFEAPAGSGEPAVGLSRQVRVGMAIDRGAVGGAPLTVALDVDLARYSASQGDRRVVAVGVERWLLGKRLGVRGGGRINTAGAQDRSVTAGMSVAARPGLFVEGHAVAGGSADEQGWGVGVRVSF